MFSDWTGAFRYAITLACYIYYSVHLCHNYFFAEYGLTYHGIRPSERDASRTDCEGDLPIFR